MQWDIFCELIDNYGDLGVCWRLACDLHARGQSVRLWLNDASHLAWLAPNASSSGIEVRLWSEAEHCYQAGDVLLEAFGCRPPAAVLAAGCVRKPLHINLEYLSAEDYVERMHGLPSPHTCADGSVWPTWFFYPGFTRATGGLLREPDYEARRSAFDPHAWLQAQGIAPAASTTLVSLFCYEPPLLAAWLQLLLQSPQHHHILVCAGRAQAAFEQALRECGIAAEQKAAATLRWSYLPFMSQLDFDHLLWACDINFVRGEDSLVRAIWASKPFVWQIYPQDDGAHAPKLEAFMQAVQLPAAAQKWQGLWNGLQTERPSAEDWLALQACKPHYAAISKQLTAQNNLGENLLAYAQSKRNVQAGEVTR